MTETWAIALFAAIGSLLTGAMGWIAVEIKEMRRDLREFVSKHECEVDMQKHCSQLTDLYNKVNDNAAEIRELQGKIKIWHCNNS